MTPRYAARVYTMTATIYSKKSACRLGFRLINFLITNSSEWERVSDWRGRRHFIDRLQNFWCDWWPARGKGGEKSARTRKPGVRSRLLLILQILLVISFIFIQYYWLPDVRICPPAHWVRGRGREEEGSCSRHRAGRGLCLQVQKATMICDIKIQGRLKLQNVSVRLIKNNPTWKNNRARVSSSRSYFSIGRDRNSAIICTNWVLCLVWKINGELLLTAKIKKWERKVRVWKRKRERERERERERHLLLIFYYS